MNGKAKYGAALTALLCGGLYCSAHAAEGDAGQDGNTMSFGTGLDYSTGKYGTRQRSRTLSQPFMAAYDTDNYGFEVSVPYLWQSGPAGTIAGARRRPILGLHNYVSEHGWGDITAGLTRILTDNPDSGWSTDVKGIVKFATADASKGLGTGKNDYSLQGDVFKDWDRFGASGTLGYSVLGSPGTIVVTGVQQDIVFHNVFYGYLGGSYKISDTLKAGLTFHREQAAEKGGFKQKDVTVSLRQKLSSSTRLQYYLLKGLAAGSPGMEMGATVNTSF